MTKEELDLYIELQPLLKKKMGKWQVGDKCHDTYEGRDGFVLSICFPPETTFVERLDYVDGAGDVYYQTTDYMIRIPLTIDAQNPERGLWGMLNDTFKALSYEPANTGPKYHLGAYVRRMYYDFRQAGDTPTINILQALKEQQRR